MDLKLPNAWEDQFGVIVLDPDGWRGANGKSWDEPITSDEFWHRMAQSTTIGAIAHD